MAESSQHVVKITGDVSGLERSFKQLESSIGDLKKRTLEFAGAWASFEGIKKITELSASLRDLKERIALTSKNQAEYNTTMKALFDIAQRTGKPLQEIQTAYANIAVAASGSGIEQQKLLNILEAVTKAVEVSGGSTQEATAATQQFIKSLVTGEASGRQFMGILNSSSYLTKVLADAITNGSVPALQEMAQQGELTVEQMTKLGDPEILAKINTVFEGIGSGSEKAFTRFKNELTDLFSQFDDVAGISEGLATSLDDLTTYIKENADAWKKDFAESIKGATAYMLGLEAELAILKSSLAHPLDALMGKQDPALTKKLEELQNKMAKLAGVADDSKGSFDDFFQDLDLEFGALASDSGKPHKAFKKLTDDAKNFQKTLEKLRDSIDLQVQEKSLENMNTPMEDSQKLAIQLRDELERNKKAFSELGAEGEKQVNRIADSLEALQKEEQKAKNIKFMEFAEDEIRQQEDKLREAAEEPFLNAARGIQSAFADMFSNIFENGVDSFGDLGDQLKKIMFTVIGQIAAAMVFKPVVSTVVGGLAGSGLISAATAGDIGKSLGLSTTGGMGGGIKDLFSGASSLYSLASGSTTTALTGLGMPAGLAGGLGVALPAVGIVAAIAGLAGMFGGHKKHPGGGFYGMLDSSGNIDNFELKSKHIDPQAVQSLVDTLKPVFQQLSQDTINLTGEQIRGRITATGKGQFGVQTGIGATESIKWLNEFDPAKADELDKAMTSFIMELTKTADVTNQDVVEALKNMNTEGKSLAQVLDEINFAASKDALRKQLSRSLATDLTKLFDPSLAEIGAENDRYLAQLETAKKIGGDVAMVEKLHAANLEQIREKYAQVTITADGMTTSVSSLSDAVKDASQRFETFGKIVENLTNFATSLKLGDLSPLSAQQKYSIAQSTFEQTASLARLGNVDAMNNLPGVAQQFLTISREFNAGSGAYTEDFNKVQSAIDDSKAVAERQRDLAQGQVDTLNAQLAEMQKQTDLLQKMVDSKNPKGFSYGAAYLSNLANPAASGLINTSIGETADSVKKMNWGSANGLEVRALARALGYTGAFGTGGLDAMIQGDSAFKELFNEALLAIGGTPKFRAGGGMVNPGFPYIVGESGEEGFIPTIQGRIAGASETAAMMSFAGRSNNDNVIVQAITGLASEIRSTNSKLTALQMQVNQNQLYRKVG